MELGNLTGQVEEDLYPEGSQIDFECETVIAIGQSTDTRFLYTTYQYLNKGGDVYINGKTFETSEHKILQEDWWLVQQQ